MKEDAIGSAKIIRRTQDGIFEFVRDDFTVEEPLVIRIGRKTVATTMRTPGHDEELAAGFLLSEGTLGARDQIGRFLRPGTARNRENIIIVEPVAGAKLKQRAISR